MAGARLGASTDVVPVDRFEPDAGPDPDVDPLRANAGQPVRGRSTSTRSLRPAAAGVELDARAGSPTTSPTSPATSPTACATTTTAASLEALWWWQFSYLSDWGEQALSSHRALHSIVSHQRLDVDEEAVIAAEADALLRD